MEKNFLDNDIYNKENIKNKESKTERKIKNIRGNALNSTELEHLDELINGEGTTMYGEFVTSYFVWTGLNLQKIRANELANITNPDTEKK